METSQNVKMSRTCLLIISDPHNPFVTPTAPTGPVEGPLFLRNPRSAAYGGYGLFLEGEIPIIQFRIAIEAKLPKSSDSGL